MREAARQQLVKVLAEAAATLSTGVRVYSAFAYVSTSQHPSVAPSYGNARRIVLALKSGDEVAARVVAKRLLAQHPELRNFRGTVVPAPRSTAARRPHTHLAEALLALGVGTAVESLVQRVKDVPSSRERRRQGLPGLSVEEHLDTLGVKQAQPRGGVLIVDDVFTTGSTIKASIKALRRAGFSGPFSAAVAAYVIEQPGAAPALRGQEQEVRASYVWFGEALDALEPHITEWVFSGSATAKKNLFAAYDALDAKAKAAWDADVAKAFRRVHGGDTAQMFRRTKGEDPGRVGGLSLTTEFPRQGANVQVYEVSVNDVFAHHGQPDISLASKAFGHEKEVILRPRANPRHLGTRKPQ